MPSKVWTILDSRLSNILIALFQPPEATIFPSLWYTSIQYVIPNSYKFQIRQEAAKYINSKRKIKKSILFSH